MRGEGARGSALVMVIPTVRRAWSCSPSAQVAAPARTSWGNPTSWDPRSRDLEHARISTKCAHFSPLLGGFHGVECSPVPKKVSPQERVFPEEKIPPKGVGLVPRSCDRLRPLRTGPRASSPSARNRPCAPRSLRNRPTVWIGALKLIPSELATCSAQPRCVNFQETRRHRAERNVCAAPQGKKKKKRMGSVGPVPAPRGAS